MPVIENGFEKNKKQDDMTLLLIFCKYSIYSTELLIHTQSGDMCKYLNIGSRYKITIQSFVVIWVKQKIGVVF